MILNLVVERDFRIYCWVFRIDLVRFLGVVVYRKVFSIFFFELWGRIEVVSKWI